MVFDSECLLFFKRVSVMFFGDDPSSDGIGSCTDACKIGRWFWLRNYSHMERLWERNE